MIKKSNLSILLFLLLVSFTSSCKKSVEKPAKQDGASTEIQPHPSEQEKEPKIEPDDKQNLEAECFQGSTEACDQLGH